MTEHETGRSRTRTLRPPASRDDPGPAGRATRIAADRIRQLKDERSLTAATLAARCAELGAPAITTHVIASIQTHRRGISVDELLIFALALDVPPAQLLTPIAAQDDASDTGTALAVTSTTRIDDPEQARRWIIGEQPLPGTQEHLYYAFTLKHPHSPEVTNQALTAQARAVLHEGAKNLAAQYEAQIEQFTLTMRSQVNDLLDDLDQAIAGTPTQITTAVERARTRLSPPAPSVEDSA